MSGVRPAGVHVKVIGSANSAFQSGETDLRGVYVGDAVRGKVTAIARDEESRYAFYRGESWLGQPEEVMAQQRQQIIEQPAAATEIDYQGNLRIQNDQMQRAYNADWDRLRRSGRKGVQVDKAR